MQHFFPLFLERSSEAISKNKVSLKLNGDEESEIIKDFLKTKPLYGGFDEFLNHCKNEIENRQTKTEGVGK